MATARCTFHLGESGVWGSICTICTESFTIFHWNEMHLIHTELFIICFAVKLCITFTHLTARQLIRTTDFFIVIVITTYQWAYSLLIRNADAILYSEFPKNTRVFSGHCKWLPELRIKQHICIGLRKHKKMDYCSSQRDIWRCRRQLSYSSISTVFVNIGWQIWPIFIIVSIFAKD